MRFTIVPLGSNANWLAPPVMDSAIPPGPGHAAGIQPHQFRRRRRRAEWSEQAGRVVAMRDHTQGVRGHAGTGHRFVTRHDGRHDLPPGRADFTAHGQRGGDDSDARVAHRGIMRVVQLITMRRGAVHQPRRCRAREASAADQWGGSGGPVAPCPFGQHQSPGLHRTGERDGAIVQDQLAQLADIGVGQAVHRQGG